MPKRQPGQQTEDERLRAVYRVYYELNGRQPVSLLDVANWACFLNLFPVPGLHDPPEQIAAWEQRLAAAQQPVTAQQE